MRGDGTHPLTQNGDFEPHYTPRATRPSTGEPCFISVESWRIEFLVQPTVRRLAARQGEAWDSVQLAVVHWMA